MTKKKRDPWFKFYPSDWRADPLLRACSANARALWIEMICLMHEAEQRGYLMLNGSAVAPDMLAALAGLPIGDVAEGLSELERMGVFSRDRRGVIYSRRMVNDEIKARKSRDNGKKGGNPRLGKQRQNPSQDNPPDKAELKPHIPEAIFQKPEEKEREASASLCADAPSAATEPPRKRQPKIKFDPTEEMRSAWDAICADEGLSDERRDRVWPRFVEWAQDPPRDAKRSAGAWKRAMRTFASRERNQGPNRIRQEERPSNDDFQRAIADGIARGRVVSFDR